MISALWEVGEGIDAFFYILGQLLALVAFGGMAVAFLAVIVLGARDLFLHPAKRAELLAQLRAHPISTLLVSVSILAGGGLAISMTLETVGIDTWLK